jgi:hypothetical protein
LIGNKWVSGVLLDKASEGDGGGGGGDQTPVTLKQVQELVDKSINGFGKRLEGEQKKAFGAFESKFDALIAKLDKGTGGDEGTDGGDVDGDGGDTGKGKGKGDGNISPALKAQMDAQQRQIKDLLKKVTDSDAQRDAASKKAEETERYSAIRAELSKYPILPESIDDAFDLFKGRVARSEDGILTVGDTTMEAHIKSVLERNSGLLKPADKGGAGSTPGGKTGRVGLEDIKAGMSPETEAAAIAQINALLPK